MMIKPPATCTSSAPKHWEFEPPDVIRLSGEEHITGTENRAVDFWSWAYSDLRANTVRPMLAEFLVASALGTATGSRKEWATYDVDIPGRGRVEVKSAAFLQAWPQDHLSKIQFGGLRSRAFSEECGMSTEITFNADVYVFAVLGGKTHDDYFALDTSRWLFWVLPRGVIYKTDQNSMNLATVEHLGATAVTFTGLEEAILKAWRSEHAGEPS